MSPRPLTSVPSLDALVDGRVEPRTLPTDVTQALAHPAAEMARALGEAR